MENKSPELEIAIEAALQAGKILEKYFETEILKQFKEDRSIVTVADKEAEEVIKKTILEKFPNHSILGEETGRTGDSSEYVWHIDPVDGTTNFANGIPIFAVSIALENKGKIIVGVIHNPVTNSLFYAEYNKGAYFNKKKISVSKDNETKGIVTVCSTREKPIKDLARNLFRSLPDLIRSVRDLGCTSLELAYVARGGTEANIQMGLHTYDFAAGVLLVEEAGGKITKLDGSPWEFPENYFLASNGVFHDMLLEEVKNQKLKLGIN